MLNTCIVLDEVTSDNDRLFQFSLFRALHSSGCQCEVCDHRLNVKHARRDVVTHWSLVSVRDRVTLDVMHGGSQSVDDLTSS